MVEMSSNCKVSRQTEVMLVGLNMLSSYPCSGLFVIIVYVVLIVLALMVDRKGFLKSSVEEVSRIPMLPRRAPVGQMHIRSWIHLHYQLQWQPSIHLAG